jgi:hypothetical protein
MDNDKDIAHRLELTGDANFHTGGEGNRYTLHYGVMHPVARIIKVC